MTEPVTDFLSPDRAPAPAALPIPTRERWQPLRSGVLNLYRYDEEEFHYADGRLLLRGNNGSGKSRVLALQLPFLLDGEVTPARVEPDGDSAKRIEWNLLMGRHKDRTGYTWIEFGRRDAAGAEHFVTLGCGLRAVEGQTGLQSRWFFVTHRRPGRDFVLLNEQRIPLGRERLGEVLGVDGRVFQKAEDYRRAVDEALFGLGPRYGALIELLLKLRRPQLTRKLDENELPQALSEALPTLSATIVDEVAESFRSLQADKDTLRDFVASRDAVAAFLQEYGAYLRIAVRRRAAEVRGAQSGYEAAQRAAKDAQARLDAAAAALAALAAAHGELQNRLAAAEADERTLAESPEMKTAGELRSAEELAITAAQALAAAQKDEALAATALARAESRLRQIEEASAALAERCAEALSAVASAAREADLLDAHHAQLPAGAPPAALAAAEAGFGQMLSRRNAAIRLLRRLADELATAETARASAEDQLREAELAATTARDEEHAAGEALAANLDALAAAYAAWQSAAPRLRPPPPSELTEAFTAWRERREGRSPFRRAAEAAHTTAFAAFAARDAALRQTMAEHKLGIQQLVTEIERLEQGETVPPLPPPTRRAERRGRAGAPLWRICDFRPEVAPGTRAGLEAALQASGLLDAWLMPDGSLLAPDEDSFLITPTDASAAPVSHLGTLLVPALDPDSPFALQFEAEVIAHVLAGIGAAPDEGSHWVAPDGSWRLGPLAGRWTKAEPEYIGEVTRAATRRRQLEQLRARRGDLEKALAQVRADLDSLAAEGAEAEAEFAAAPDEEPVRRAGYDLARATEAVAVRMLVAERAGRLADARRADYAQAEAKLQTDATDLGLAPWLGRLDVLSEATQQYATALAALWPTLRHADAQTAQLVQAREQRAETASRHAELNARHQNAEASAAAARQRFTTLRDTHGATVTEVLARHGAAKIAVAQTKIEIESNHAARVTRTAEQSTAQAELVAANEKREAQEEVRRLAIARLRELAEQRLLAEAVPHLDPATHDEPWSVAHAVRVARELEAALAEAPADVDAWRHRQDQIHGHIQELRDHLVPHGHQPETHQVDEIVLVRCLFQARPHSMTELHAAFALEIEARDRLLQAREREIIENHLLAEAAVELQKLIRAAEAWRASANDELHARPTSTGVRFRFQWEPDAEIRFHEVRPVLLRQGELWTPAERTAVAAFLQGRIAAEQAADESGSWRDHLARALDYRRWHRFIIERQQEGQWRRLNKTTYGTGSGGEKALALTLPRFAAAAAHYRGAAPHAPRLVLLDEAFAGIDPTMRAQCLGVLTQFDLDVVMTSELEWGCYATVPALAIYHLTTLPGLDAVAASRWLWNGRERRQLDHGANA